MYFGLAVIEWNVPPDDFWDMTLQEFWLLLDFKKSGGKPKAKVKPMSKSRLKEMIAADEERQRKKASRGDNG